MSELAFLLASGAKGFFEKPEYLLGLPLLLLGVLGVLIVFSPVEVRWPQPPPPEELELHEPVEGHPSAAEYIRIGLILAVITAFEVMIYYVDMAQGALLIILLTLSAMKFVLVALWFMHLKFDSRIFSIAFTGAMVLVMALFAVVLTSLGSSLI
jgi:cytochrome c oxidase subunit 4